MLAAEAVAAEGLALHRELLPMVAEMVVAETQVLQTEVAAAAGKQAVILLVAALEVLALFQFVMQTLI